MAMSDDGHGHGANGQDGDERLLAELRGVVERLDPVPGHVTAAANAALGWRTLEDDIAELLYDSIQDQALAGVRAEDQPRLLSFRGGSLEIEVEVSGSGPDRTLTGQLMPAGPAQIHVRHGAGVMELEADAQGRFVAEGVPAGTVSLRCRTDRPGGEPSLATPWLPI